MMNGEEVCFDNKDMIAVQNEFGGNKEEIESKIKERMTDIADLKKMSFLSKMLNVVSSYMKNSLNVYARINNLKQDIAIGNALLNNNPEERATAMKTALSKKSSFMDRREKITLNKHLETQLESLKSLNKLIFYESTPRPVKEESISADIPKAYRNNSPKDPGISHALQNLTDRKNKTTRNTIKNLLF